MKKLSFILLILSVFWSLSAFETEKIEYSDSWGKHGFELLRSSDSNVEINYSIRNFSFSDLEVNKENFKKLNLPGTLLPNNEGAPDLPGMSKFIAFPQNARIELNLLDYRIERFQNVNISPAPRIPLETEDGPLEYNRDQKIYNKDEFYPADPIQIGDHTKIRGVDVVMLGITPFQYNPVTEELLVYRDINLEIEFIGGNGHFGEDRLRNRWWDPILKDAIFNSNSLPEINYSLRSQNRDGAEYLVICPDDADFLAWADSIKTFRQLQGISTMIKTTTEVGGNTTTAIENYVNNAYNNWTTPPAAILLLGDYGTSGNTIVSPIWDGYCVSDNIYADVNNNDMPDIVFARMTAQNNTHLQTMVTKALDYERNPPTNSDFYNNPITALGWQTERWFQICSETVGGYFLNEQGKSPVRINAIYSGSPGSTWSTATNTSDVVNYFGPSGLGYIPATPAELGGWSGGTGTDVENALNSGAFILQHRDHGSTTGWGEPDFQSSDIDNLTNTDLSFIFSINCLTGKYNLTGECFAEKFHRYTYGGQNSGALGIIAASETSYSFVNDTYVWGMYDNMWPDFMPDYGTTPDSRGILPAFGNAAGKYFLQQSNWPYNTSNKLVTYHLFHHHGDAFTSVYSEMPQNLTINHNNQLLSGATSFSVTADNGSFIALTVNGEIIGTAEGTGSPVPVSIPAQDPGDVIIVTVTKQNYYRYSGNVDVIPPTGPYVSFNSYTINDPTGNNNGEADYNEDITLDVVLENMGSAAASNVSAILFTTDSYATITDNSQSFGTINAGTTATQNDAYAISIADDIPDQHSISFSLTITGTSDDTWNSNFTITVNAPEFEIGNITIDDTAGGNGNGRLDADETADVIITNSNVGSSLSPSAIATLNCTSGYITINTGTDNLGQISVGGNINAVFNVTTDPSTPTGTSVTFDYDITAGNYDAQDNFEEIVGQIPVCIIDLDPNASSGPEIETAFNTLGIANDYVTSIPADLNLYSSAFVCLGIYSSNHVLSSAEGTELANFLNNGGNLYMEGGDTWYYDSQTAVHSMFNINATDDGSGDLSNLLGQTGTFAVGMTFSYSGENNWIDHIEPISPAVSLFQNDSPAYGAAVSYDEGSYKTIGASFEFGGLDDGTLPSTKVELISEIADFFGLSGGPAVPGFSMNPTSLDFGDVMVGDSTIEQFTITNTGNAALSGNITTPIGYSVATDSRSENSVSENTISYSLTGYGSETYDITFSPTSTTTYNYNATITSNDPNYLSNDLTLTGTGVSAPDIAVTPSSYDVSLQPGETSDEAMTISNYGGGDLDFSIAIEETDIVAGLMPQEINIDLENKLRNKNMITNSTDENSVSKQNRKITVLPPIKNYETTDNRAEETFGSWNGGTYSGDTRDRGNIYHVTTSTTLTEARFYLNINSTTQLYFFVYQGNSLSGTYNKIDEKYVSDSGTGEGWYSSGSIDVTLDAGYYYYIGTSWNGTATYGRGTESVPLTTSFGTLETGIPSSLAGYPPATTISNSTTGLSPYYQTIVTGASSSNWLTANPNSGTVSSGSSSPITITFDASELDEGTYTADIEISSNDPDQPNITIPATLNVSLGGTPAISVVPSSINFGDVQTGSSETEQFTISNSGTGTLMGTITTPTGYTVLESDLSRNNLQRNSNRNSINYTITAGNSTIFDLLFEPTNIQTYNGDVVIAHNAGGDDETISVTGTGVSYITYPYLEDFEEGGSLPADWIQDTGDDFDWDVNSGATGSSGTGPSGDHTTGFGYYLYTESSSPNYPSLTANIATPVFDFSSLTNPMLQFWYHMYGTAMGTLNVDYWDGAAWVNLWTLSGDQGDSWQYAEISLTGISSTKFRFNGITGTSYTSDIAIDDFGIYDAISPPGCTTLVSPPDGSIDIPVNGTLEWNAALAADGYRINFGTDNPPTNILNNYDNGNVTSYTYSNLSGETNYYWQIVPYNAFGNASGCDIWSFTTYDVSTGVLIGTADQTWNYPFSTYYMDARMQTIYLASEMADGRTIESLKLNVETAPGQTLENVYIRLKETADNTLAAFDNTDLTQVYHGTSIVVPAGSWYEFVFDTPFTYTGVNNLLVDIVIDNSSYTSDGATWVFTDDRANRSCYYRSDLNTGNLLTFSGGTGTNIVNQIQFTGDISGVLNGNLNGLVTEYGTDTPIPDAEVTIGSHTAMTLPDGSYSITDIVTGTYDVTCTAEGYYDETATDVIITENNTTTQDFGLLWSEISSNPSAATGFNISIEPDGSINETLTLYNSGPGDMVYACGINFLSDIALRPVGAKPTILDQDRKTINFRNSNTEIPPAEPSEKLFDSDATGDILMDLDLETVIGDNQLLGCEFDGTNIWISGGGNSGDNQLYQLDASGNLLNTYPQNTTSDWGIRDMTFDGVYLYGGDENGFYQIDPNTGTVTTLFSTLPGGLTCIRALAYVPSVGFIANNWTGDLIVFDSSGTQLGSLAAPAISNMYGLAFDVLNNVLWIYDRAGTPETTIMEYDISTQTLTGVSYQIPLLNGATTQMNGGLFYSTDLVSEKIVLGGVTQGDPVDRFFVMEVEDIESWLSFTANNTGIVSGYGSEDVSINFDATDLSLGDVKTANIIVTNNAGTGDDHIVPVTMTVESGQFDPPTNVQINVNGDNVELSWNAVSGATTYHIYYSTQPDAGFTELDTSPTNSYIHVDGAQQTSYFYYITAE